MYASTRRASLPLTRESLFDEVGASAGDSYAWLTDLEAVGDVLIESVNDTHFSAFSRFLAREELARTLHTRSIVEGYRLPKGPLAARQVIVIGGLPRTGTTLLQHLLALDETNSHIRHWEAMRPSVRMEELSGTNPLVKAETVRLCEERLRLFQRMAPAFAAIHPIDVDGPEECNVLLQQSLNSLQFLVMFRLPAYCEWLMNVDWREPYDLLADQIAMIEGNSERTLVLKSPGHVMAYPQLLRLFPNLVLIQIWRDPKIVLASWCSLVEAVRHVFSSEVDASALGSEWSRFWQLMVDRATNDLKRQRSPVEVVNVMFDDLVSDPLRTVEVIYERAGIQLEHQTRATMSKWIKAQRLPIHRYRTTDYGLAGTDGESLTRAYGDLTSSEP